MRNKLRTQINKKFNGKYFFLNYFFPTFCNKNYFKRKKELKRVSC